MTNYIPPIHLRNVPPPPETFNHQEFLLLMAKWIKPVCYLELGIRDGRCLLPISQFCKEAIGVDIELNLNYGKHGQLNPNTQLIKKTTDEFFATLPSDIRFDMVFIDADHNHKQVLTDFTNVAPHVIEDGFIFFHDTCPYDASLINIHFCLDCYKTPLYIKQNLSDHFEVLTLPFNPGVSVVRKISKKKQMAWLAEGLEPPLLQTC